MDEIEEYRDKIERRYAHRRKYDRYVQGGRRKSDYKPPPLVTWWDAILFIPLLIVGLCLIFLMGCKRIVNGG